VGEANRTVTYYRVTPPDGDPFIAIIVDTGGRAAVLSNRNGKWEPEPHLTVADLNAPSRTSTSGISGSLIRSRSGDRSTATRRAILNMGTAQALDFDIPLKLRGFADEVIE
jgi:hypothetical protein